MRTALIVPATLLFGLSTATAQLNGAEEGDPEVDPHELFVRQDPRTKLYGYAAADGRTVPARFEEAHPFAEGYAVVKEHGAWGMIDPTGRLLLDTSYGAVWAAEAGSTIAFRPNSTDPCLVEIGLKVKCVPFAAFWTAWKEVLAASAVPDKVLIIRVLEMYPEPERRIAEMANMEATYTLMPAVRAEATRRLLQAK